MIFSEIINDINEYNVVILDSMSHIKSLLLLINGKIDSYV